MHNDGAVNSQSLAACLAVPSTMPRECTVLPQLSRHIESSPLQRGVLVLEGVLYTLLCSQRTVGIILVRELSLS